MIKTRKSPSREALHQPVVGRTQTTQQSIVSANSFFKLTALVQLNFIITCKNIEVIECHS